MLSTRHQGGRQPGRDVPLGRPRPALAGRSGATSLLASPKATTPHDIKPQSVRQWPDGDGAARRPYLAELRPPWFMGLLPKPSALQKPNPTPTYT